MIRGCGAGPAHHLPARCYVRWMATAAPSPVPGLVPQPRRRRAPRVLVAVGVTLVVLGIVALVFGIITFTRTLPLGVLDGSGGPGPDVLAAAEAPGELSIALAADEPVTIWATSVERGAGPRWHVEVRAADGTTQRTHAGVSSTMRSNGMRAVSVADFTPPAAGTYVISVRAQETTSPAGHVLVTEAVPVPTFITRLLTGIGLFFVAAAAGTLGIALGTAGAIWWAISANGDRARSAAPSAPALRQ